MTSANEPIICFGQQPNGFFPKRFFYAKIETARKLQKHIGGKIIYFCHDSDADPRETVTILIDKQTGKEARLNFEAENKVQKKYSPLYAKKILSGWQEKTVRLLPQYADTSRVDLFARIREGLVADFCLAMYKEMGLLENIDTIRSSDADFRTRASSLKDEFYIDVPYQGETVRAKYSGGRLSLHEGGEKYIQLPVPKFTKTQVSAGREARFAWMQSVINCTHYIYGEGEKNYLDTSKFPDVAFIDRQKIEHPERAYL